MSELLTQICAYVIIQGSTNVCNKTLTTAYNASPSVHDPLESERKKLEKESLDLYDEIPYNQVLVVAYGSYVIYNKNGFNAPLSSNIDVSYGGNMYSCKWHVNF